MKKGRITTGLLLILIIAVACSHNTQNKLENALRASERNRLELEKVLAHYKQHAADSLKYKAACFLIENMPVHCSYEKSPEFYSAIDSLNRSALNPDELFLRMDSILRKNQLKTPRKRRDPQNLSSKFLIEQIDKSFENWEKAPWKDKFSPKDFCEYVLPYAVSQEKREIWIDYYRNKYLPFIADKMKNYNAENANLINLCIALNDSLRKISPMAIRTVDLGNYPPAAVDHIRFGNCEDYVARTIYLMRSLGMPVGKDFAPQWGSYAQSHSWNTLLAEDGRHYPFTGFDDGIDEWHLDYRIDCPKMFRITYGIQKESLAAQEFQEEIPDFLKQANLIDVTKEYLPVSDVTLPIDNPHKKKAVYLCVFNNKNWIPVHWGLTNHKQVVFKDMGRKVVYLPAFYMNKRFISAGCPFILDSLGRVIPLQAGKEKETLRVERKFHSRKMREIFLPRMLNGRFTGANKPDFSDEKTLYQILEFPQLSFNRIDLENDNEYRYIRYLASSGNYPDIAELEVYTKENEVYRKLSGKVVGTDGAAYEPIEKYGKQAAFDGDWLTFFSNHDDGAWVGLDFGKKERINRIRFLPRNDDNSIHPGDEYELLYWDRGKWNSLGKKTGDESYVLVYDNCPTGVLFLLHNHTKGNEERIFTYENSRQVFW
jgi:hypothetical protein